MQRQETGSGSGSGSGENAPLADSNTPDREPLGERSIGKDELSIELGHNSGSETLVDL